MAKVPSQEDSVKLSISLRRGEWFLIREILTKLSEVKDIPVGHKTIVQSIGENIGRQLLDHTLARG